MSTSIITPIESAIIAIKQAPKAGQNILWAEDINVPYLVAVAIIKSDDQEAAALTISRGTGASINSIRHFARGNMASSAHWPALRKMLSDAGIKWNDNKPGRPRNASADIAPHADAVPPADFTVTVPGLPTTPITVKPATTLAVTNKGEVITATPPAAETTPTAMVAQGGDFAVKQNTTRCAIDTNTGDILVITTRRILYGSAEHRAKMIEMNAKKA